MLARSMSMALSRAHCISLKFKIIHKQNSVLSDCGRAMQCLLDVPWRCKYVQNKGVKGIRSKKSAYDVQRPELAEGEEEQQNESDSLNLDDREYDEVVGHAMHVSRGHSTAQNVFIIQPYVKWGAKRNVDTPPDAQLQEAEALIRSLPNWQVSLAVKVPLESLERKALFGSGKMEELQSALQQLRAERTAPTCIFVSKGTLSFAQKRTLEAAFQLPVMDRYSVVVQILRLHATSAEARLQVAMAEIPYIWAQAKDANASQARKQGYSLTDTQREILKTRERKLRNALERIRGHRKLLRNKRKQKNYPVVAVVGYTNAGKTSLIKALTQEQSMQPRDQLFATLDVTAHAGQLPCNLQVIYMDTVGFMSDLPTGLIECFVATLEDAMLADVIVHVQDLSHSCHAAQKAHVECTLQSLAQSIGNADSEQKLPPIIDVGNKIDLVAQADTTSDQRQQRRDMQLVSAKQQTGLQPLLLEIERQILFTTGRRKLTMRVRNGGAEMSWLYKNAAVVDTRTDAQSAEHLLIAVVISQTAMQQFKRQFCE